MIEVRYGNTCLLTNWGCVSRNIRVSSMLLAAILVVIFQGGDVGVSLSDSGHLCYVFVRT